jgi:hypothetical protein
MHGANQRLDGIGAFLKERPALRGRCCDLKLPLHSVLAENYESKREGDHSWQT